MKRIISAIAALITVLCMGSSVFAADLHNPDLNRVVDKAGIFTDGERETLESNIKKLTDKYGMDFVIYTDEDAHGKTLEKGAEDFYDEQGYGVGDENSGSLVYICFDPSIRAWYTTACGESIKYFDYDNINIIDDAIEHNMIEGNFFGAMITYIDYVNELYERGSLYDKEARQYYGGDGWQSYGEPEPQSSEKKQSYLVMGGFSVVAGLVAGIAARSNALKSMKTVELQTQADNYKAQGSFKLTRSENILMSVMVNRVPKSQPPQNKGSGGMHSGGSSFSSSHMSSGGHMHSGGGGRHF